MCGCEGPLYSAVRGAGLAYGMHILHFVDVGQISLNIGPANDIVKAYERAMAEIKRHVDDDGSYFRDDLLLAARTTAIYTVVGSCETVSNLQKSTCVATMRGQHTHRHEKFLKRLAEVTPAEARAAGVKWLKNLHDFQPGKNGTIFITDNESKVDAIKESFHTLMGWDLNIQS
eukprot:GHVO01006350.1.p2 GENE.GHVO01006350.1~~GHVO01006350.1.p2  ORF type:complete len:173 (+),score=33.04 GHVO01006350.1:666-1184(+)